MCKQLLGSINEHRPLLPGQGRLRRDNPGPHAIQDRHEQIQQFMTVVLDIHMEQLILDQIILFLITDFQLLLLWEVVQVER